jgi:hypothetical protein
MQCLGLFKERTADKYINLLVCMHQSYHAVQGSHSQRRHYPEYDKMLRWGSLKPERHTGEATCLHWCAHEAHLQTLITGI